MKRHQPFIVAGLLAVCLSPPLAQCEEKFQPAAPTKVVVVNTQDESASLVDIAAMKELSRHKVGPRPYGVAVSRDGKSVAVGVEDEECVKFFSLPDFAEKGRVKIGKMHNDHIVPTQDGKHILVAMTA